MATALEKIQAIQAKAQQEIEELKREAVSELAKRLSDARQEVRILEKEYETLTGKTVKGERAGKQASDKRFFNNADELKSFINNSEVSRLSRKNFNDGGFSLKSAIETAKANPKVFGYKQNGPQGEVWLK